MCGTKHTYSQSKKAAKQGENRACGKLEKGRIYSAILGFATETRLSRMRSTCRRSGTSCPSDDKRARAEGVRAGGGAEEDRNGNEENGEGIHDQPPGLSVKFVMYFPYAMESKAVSASKTREKRGGVPRISISMLWPGANLLQTSGGTLHL